SLYPTIMSDSAAGSLSAENVSALQRIVAQIISQFIVFGMHYYYDLASISLTFKACTSPSLSLVYTFLCDLIALTFVMFSAALIGNVITMKAVSTNIARLGPNPPVFDLNYAIGSIIAADSLLRLNWILSDAVVVWRAWTLWPKHRTIQVILIVCMLASIGVSEKQVGCILLIYLVGKGPPVGSGPFRLLVTLAPLITNITATILMSVKAWYVESNWSHDLIKDYNYRQYRRDLSTLGRTNNGLVKKILFFLVESGFVYCIIWVSHVASRCWVVFQTFTAIMSGMYISLAGMYPTIVIIIVAMERSCADSI
ncbi:hypothetical protein C8J56DRAFT_754079, partial [Mycena floridula]